VDWIIGDDGFKRREYADYKAYLTHQSEKRPEFEDADFFNWYHPLLRFCLAQRLPENPRLKHGSSVLCLAARSGAELQAFRDVGHHPIGIDLKPLGDGVIYGDFHHVPFEDQSFDITFTNSLDHVYDSAGFLNEVRRVTKSYFILEVGRMVGGRYESIAWYSLRPIVILLARKGFEIVRMKAYEEPWGGVQITSIP
jgi:SAM-dependent methyltransferase